MTNENMLQRADIVNTVITRRKRFIGNTLRLRSSRPASLAVNRTKRGTDHAAMDYRKVFRRCVLPIKCDDAKQLATDERVSDKKAVILSK